MNRTPQSDPVVTVPVVSIVEFGYHLPQVEHLAALVGKVAQCEVLVRPRSKYSLHHMLHFPERIRIILCGRGNSKVADSIIFYEKVLSRVLSGKTIWVSTGPEQKILPDVLFFFFLSIVARRQVILHVRHNSAWFNTHHHDSRRSLIETARSLALQRISRLVFETMTQEAFYCLSNPKSRALTATIPTKFSDFAIADSPASMHGISGGTNVTLGLLGAIDSKKKDYSTLIDALSSLGEHERIQIEIRLIGDSSDGPVDGIVDQLSKFVRCHHSGGFLSAKEALSSALKCDFLIAPFYISHGIGTARATGAFGDALEAGKRLIVPTQVDPLGEFMDVAITYSNSEELVVLLQQLAAGGGGNLSAEPWRDSYKLENYTQTVEHLLSARLGRYGRSAIPRKVSIV